MSTMCDGGRMAAQKLSSSCHSVFFLERAELSERSIRPERILGHSYSQTR